MKEKELTAGNANKDQKLCDYEKCVVGKQE